MPILSTTAQGISFRDELRDAGRRSCPLNQANSSRIDGFSAGRGARAQGRTVPVAIKSLTAPVGVACTGSRRRGCVGCGAGLARDGFHQLAESVGAVGALRKASRRAARNQIGMRHNAALRHSMAVGAG